MTRQINNQRRQHIISLYMRKLEKLLDVLTELIFLPFRQGFYSVSGSSLSDSCYSVSSDAAQGGPVPPVPPTRPLTLWEQLPPSTGNTDILWSEGAAQKQEQPALQKSQGDGEPSETIPVSGEPCLLNPFK